MSRVFASALCGRSKGRGTAGEGGQLEQYVNDRPYAANFIATGRRRITPPAIKCRGPRYLRIIYGPEYLLPANLQRLRSRRVGAKRSLAGREFALGIEALERSSERSRYG